MSENKEHEELSFDPAIFAFLEQYGCDPSRILSVSGDWGNRSYLRVFKDGDTPCILMVCCKEDTGADMFDFVKVGQWIRNVANLSAPKIYGIDEEHGLLLLEDFGPEYCNDYLLLSECISRLQEPEPLEGLVNFKDSPVYEGHRRVIDWFVPCKLGRKNSDEDVKTYLSLWSDIEKSLPLPKTAFAHMDFHPGNFMNVAGRDGVLQCGILDFQDACVGPIAYDYTNLLKDIRQDVPENVINDVLAQTTKGMTGEEKGNFTQWYTFLCVQFHFRLAGQILRLSLVNGRNDLMVYLPRVVRYIEEELEDSMFSSLRTFFSDLGVEWSADNLTVDQSLIADNAF